MTDRQALRNEIARAVATVRGGNQEHAVTRLAKLTEAEEPVMRESVLELVGANVEMLHASVAGVATDTVEFAVDGQDDDGQPVPIDEFEPSQRAATRIMLALANDRPDDAELQLDIVAASAGPSELGLVFVHTLCWTLELLDICEEIGYDIPTWLRPLAA
jgi:chemotaxis protein histidine kinase CheA